MEYNFDNLILVNENNLYFVVHAYKYNSIYLKSIVKPTETECINTIPISQLEKDHINIIYLGNDTDLPYGRLD